MDRFLRRTFLFVFGLFVFAILWRLLFDHVTGKTKRDREKDRSRPECAEITMRMENFYKANLFFPTSATEVVRLPHHWRELRPAEELTTNYILRSVEASRAVAAGKTNVPIVFEQLRSVGRERGGLIGFVFPHKVRWYDEPAYREYLSGAR
jgi:hypothetical protein